MNIYQTRNSHKKHSVLFTMCKQINNVNWLICISLFICLHMVNKIAMLIDLFVSVCNTWNHSTVCKQMSSGLFQNNVTY